MALSHHQGKLETHTGRFDHAETTLQQNKETLSIIPRTTITYQIFYLMCDL